MQFPVSIRTVTYIPPPPPPPEKQTNENSTFPYNYQLLDEIEQYIVICLGRADQLFADAEVRGRYLLAVTCR